MFRPYWTIIRDSFRAAMASRVLYIVLALIVLILVLISPLHIREQLDWKLSFTQIPNPDRLADQLVEEGSTGKRAGIALVWQRLPASVRELVKMAADEDQATSPEARMSMIRNLIEALNDQISSKDFYDEAAFRGKRLNPEARELLDLGIDNLSDTQLRRLNRLLLYTLLRRSIDAPGATQLEFYYFNWHWSRFTLHTTQPQFAHELSRLLPGYFDKFVMSIGIFIAILVTASIIPEMLEPGSLNLLLSKPVHRWALLLTKFLGGCVFILLCATVFFIGIWLWLGIQFGVWERSVLISIPIYVFVFAMYYSISVLTGIWFRSAILSITFAILFWAICFVIGMVYGRLDNRQYNFGATQLLAGGDQVFYVDTLQNAFRWEDDRWVPVLERKRNQNDQAFAIAAYIERIDTEIADYPGPCFDETTEQILAGSADLPVVGRPSRYRLVTATNQDQWVKRTLGNLPSGTLTIFFSPRVGLLAITNSAQVYRLNSESLNGRQSDDEDQSLLAAAANSLANQTIRFEKLSDNDTVNLFSAGAISLNSTNDDIALVSGHELVILSIDETGRYQETVRQELGTHANSRMTAWVEYQGEDIFVAFGNGQFIHAKSNQLGEQTAIVPLKRATIRRLAASPDGNWAAIVYRSGDVWIYDATSRAEHRRSRVTVQGDVLAAAFDTESRLWLADRFQNAIAYGIANLDVDSQRRPPADWLTNIYRFAVRPLYRVFPRPGEFYRLVAHLSPAGDASHNPDVDLTTTPTIDDPWAPLRNGLIFTMVVLAIACIQFQRQDF